ncbi:hypothetical protein TRAPUB_1659 [Trametes pubescens]|uniref:Uncharacterized protein n=1 Tax=Trametes pubescens TaxID=154538 RepID=A0A1M2VIQ0_TRAPU|nr:hypothetical protein TRAPUB_1659 [Trametes pubescens]
MASGSVAGNGAKGRIREMSERRRIRSLVSVGSSEDAEAISSASTADSFKPVSPSSESDEESTKSFETKEVVGVHVQEEQVHWRAAGGSVFTIFVRIAVR